MAHLRAPTRHPFTARHRTVTTLAALALLLVSTGRPAAADPIALGMSSRGSSDSSYVSSQASQDSSWIASPSSYGRPAPPYRRGDAGTGRYRVAAVGPAVRPDHVRITMQPVETAGNVDVAGAAAGAGTDGSAPQLRPDPLRGERVLEVRRAAQAAALLHVGDGVDVVQRPFGLEFAWPAGRAGVPARPLHLVLSADTAQALQTRVVR